MSRIEEGDVPREVQSSGQGHVEQKKGAFPLHGGACCSRQRAWTKDDGGIFGEHGGDDQGPVMKKI